LSRDVITASEWVVCSSMVIGSDGRISDNNSTTDVSLNGSYVAAAVSAASPELQDGPNVALIEGPDSFI